jgi:hypothetical protein
MIFSRFLQLFFITHIILLGINPLLCQANAEVKPFPTDVPFLNKIKNTFLILQALNHENHNNIQKANHKWQSIIKSKSERVKEHQFISQLLLNQQLPKWSHPQTEKTILAISGYLAWNKKLDAALKALQVDLKTNDILLEEIRLNLLLGNYQQVEKEITLFFPQTKEEKLIHKILYYWYFILIGKIESAMQVSQIIEVEFLYSPHFVLHSNHDNFKIENRINRYQKSLTRYPSNEILFEYLIKNLEKVGKYCKIRHLLMLQKKIYNLATIPKYLSTTADKCSDNSDVKIKKDFGFLSWQAEQALKREQYGLLKRYARALIRLYPEYLDGQLFLAEYFRKTGQLKQYHELLKMQALTHHSQLN